MNKGVCKWGENCRYDHSQEATGRHPSGALTNKKMKEEERRVAALNASPKAKAEGKKRQGESDVGGVQPGSQKPKWQILCKYIRNPNNGPCPLGKPKCEYSHNKKAFDEKGQFKGRGRGKGLGLSSDCVLA